MNAILFPVALISPVLFFALMLGLKEAKEHPVLKALALGLCAAIAIYGMRCNSATDIYRHIALLPVYNTSFLRCFDAGNYGGLYVWDIWCWLVEKIGNPYLLQSSAAFVGYSIVAYICIDFSVQHENCRGSWAAPFLFAFCAIPVFPLVTGIRSSIAVLVCALAFYLYNQKGLPIVAAAVIDVLAVMIHQVAMFPLLFLVITPLLVKWPKRALAGCFVAFLLIATVGQLLLSVLPSGNAILEFVRKAIESLLMYDKGDSWTAANASSANGIINRVSTISLICVMVVASLRCFDYSTCDRNSIAFGLYVGLISVASAALIIVLPVNGERFLPAAYALGSSLVCEGILERDGHKNRDASFALKALIFGLCAVALLLHFYSLAYGLEDSSRLILTSAFGVLGVCAGI